MFLAKSSVSDESSFPWRNPVSLVAYYVPEDPVSLVDTGVCGGL